MFFPNFISLYITIFVLSMILSIKGAFGCRMKILSVSENIMLVELFSLRHFSTCFQNNITMGHSRNARLIVYFSTMHIWHTSVSRGEC